jgi:hypothetical protein
MRDTAAELDTQDAVEIHGPQNSVRSFILRGPELISLSEAPRQCLWMRPSVDWGEYFGGDANARQRNVRHCFDCKRIWNDREEVRIKSIMVCGAERQSVAPIVGAMMCFSAVFLAFTLTDGLRLKFGLRSERVTEHVGFRYQLGHRLWSVKCQSPTLRAQKWPATPRRNISIFPEISLDL